MYVYTFQFPTYVGWLTTAEKSGFQVTYSSIKNGFNASAVLDGVYTNDADGGNFASASNNGAAGSTVLAWLQIDLGRAHSVVEVILFNRRGDFAFNLKSHWVIITLHGWIQIVGTTFFPVADLIAFVLVIIMDNL